MIVYFHLRLLIIILVWTPRPHTVEEVFQRALKFHIVLIRGTSAPGKTILMKLIHRHVLKTCPGWVVHTFCGWPQGMNSEDSQMFLEKELKKVDNQSAKNTLVFIYDAQSSYYDHNLWSSFKTLESDSAMFILLSSYGSAGKYSAIVSTGTTPMFTLE